MVLSVSSFAKFRRLHGVAETGGIEDVGEMISRNVTAYKAEPLKMINGTVEAKFASATTQDISLVYLDWGAPAIGMSCAREDAFNLRVTMRGKASTSDPYLGMVSAERERGNARIFTLTEDTATYSHGHVGLNLVIPQQALQDRVKSYYQSELNQPLRFAPLLNLSSFEGQTITSLVDYLKAQFTETHGVLDAPMVGTQFRELMFSAIFGGISHNYKDAHINGAMDVAIPGVVKRAEDYIRANADKPLTIEVLAREAGCSERALHWGFNQFRQNSPLALLREIRLERAHEDLARANGSVTEVATKWGFSNLGRFSKLHLEKYGERPLQTLKKAPSGPAASEMK